VRPRGGCAEESGGSGHAAVCGLPVKGRLKGVYDAKDGDQDDFLQVLWKRGKVAREGEYLSYQCNWSHGVREECAQRGMGRREDPRSKGGQGG